MSRVRNFAFECIDTLNHASTVDGVMDTMWGTGKFFGFENFGVSGIPLPSETIDPYILLRGWPEDWTKRYVEHNYVQDDPIIAKTKTSTLPFSWNEVPNETMTPRARRIMDEAKEFGLVEGISVPIYTTHGFQAIVTIGAKNLRLSPDEKAALHLISIYAHSHAKRLISTPSSTSSKHNKALGRRELECLKWSSLGKSAWEISEILHLSQRTVEEYLFNASRKLNASNRVQAVAEAIRNGLIL